MRNNETKAETEIRYTFGGSVYFAAGTTHEEIIDMWLKWAVAGKGMGMRVAGIGAKPEPLAPLSPQPSTPQQEGEWEIVRDTEYTPSLIAVRAGARVIAECPTEADARMLLALQSEVTTLRQERDEIEERLIEWQDTASAAIESNQALQTALSEARAIAIEAGHTPAGYCRDCGEFTGYDQVQDVQGTAAHEVWCQVDQALTKLGDQPVGKGI